MLQMLQKICYIYTFMFLCKFERYFLCRKIKSFEFFFYYIHHQLIYNPNANQNNIINWIKVNY